MMTRVLLMTLAMTAQAVGQTVLIEKAKPLARIYVDCYEDVAPLKSRKPETLARWNDESLARAVADLKYHLKRSSGVDLEVVKTDDPNTVSAPAVVLGQLAVSLGATPPKSPSGHDGFRILTKANMVLIGGEEGPATLYGVYELLRKLGCDWVMPGEIGEVIPGMTTVAIPSLDVSGIPDFTIRAPWYSGGARIIDAEESARLAQWKRRHKLQVRGRRHHLLDPLFLQGGHVWQVLVRNYKKEFDANPDMLALVRNADGTQVRKGPQVETTDPRTVGIAVQYIKDMFKKNGWPKDATVNISMGPADGMGYSSSPESVAAGAARMDPTVGARDVTDLLVLFCNQILNRIGAEYPNLYLGFYLYSVHEEFPMRYKPHPRVAIVIADINFSRYHGISDRNSKSRTYYRTIIDNWRALSEEQGNPIYYRGYNVNLAECLMPYTKLKIWGEDIPFYKSMGSRGATTEWFKGWGNTGPSDYLEARMLWDCDLDWKEVLREYCVNAFGEKAAPFMQAYYRLLVDVQHNAGQEAGSYHASHLIFDQTFIQKAGALFARALRSAKTARQKKRIEFAKTPLTSLTLYLAYRDAFTAFDFNKARDLLDRLYAHLEAYTRENSDVIDEHAAMYLTRFQQRYVDQASTFSRGDYSIIHELPDRLKTMFDPYVVGQEMGFQSPEINDTDFIRTSTWSKPWDAQGLGGLRDGAVWYRIPFTIPRKAANQAVGLFVGGVDDVVRVWCNGNYVGTGRGFSLPFQFDLTDDVKREGVNLVAIQVQRHSKCTELGLGGILYPSFIFAGPRLEKKAPLQKPMKRVLPGGGEIGQ